MKKTPKIQVSPKKIEDNPVFAPSKREIGEELEDCKEAKEELPAKSEDNPSFIIILENREDVSLLSWVAGR